MAKVEYNSYDIVFDSLARGVVAKKNPKANRRERRICFCDFSKNRNRQDQENYAYSTVKRIKSSSKWQSFAQDASRSVWAPIWQSAQLSEP